MQATILLRFRVPSQYEFPSILYGTIVRLCIIGSEWCALYDWGRGGPLQRVEGVPIKGSL